MLGNEIKSKGPSSQILKPVKKTARIAILVTADLYQLKPNVNFNHNKLISAGFSQLCFFTFWNRNISERSVFAGFISYFMVYLIWANTNGCYEKFGARIIFMLLWKINDFIFMLQRCWGLKWMESHWMALMNLLNNMLNCTNLWTSSRIFKKVFRKRSSIAAVNFASY